MGRFKRRRPRVVWLPVHGRDFSLSEGGNFGNGIGGVIPLSGNAEIETDVQPVTFDYSDSASQEEGTEFRSLQDLTQGNAYRLRRLVGKFHAAAVISGTPAAVYGPADLAAGFMVCRTDADGNILQGASTITGDITRGPLAQDGAEDPWIWRRRYLLSPIPPSAVFPDAGGVIAAAVSVTTQLGGQGQWPHTTAGFGSVADGPHIDQKTARVISNEERLFFWVQARQLEEGSSVGTISINWQLDLRILASLRTNVGNRRNASR